MSLIKSNELNYLKYILVLQHMYLGHKGNAKILIKNFQSMKSNTGGMLYTVHTIQLQYRTKHMDKIYEFRM